MLKKYICGKCGAELDITDLDTKYLDVEGMQDGYACDNCNEWWITSDVAATIVQAEKDSEAKMQ